MRLERAQIIEDYRDFPLGAASCVCLGNFDGLHLGHQQILETCLVSAKRQGLRSVAFTFFPHPMRALLKNSALRLILTRKERRELLDRSGVNCVLEQNFTSEFSQISAEAFCEQVLFRTLNAKIVVVGKNFRFGKGAQGGAELLRSQTAFETLVVDSVAAVGIAMISSSHIRGLIENGEIDEANRCLGYPYFLSGEVTKGDGRGHELGFPTANLKSDKECLPKVGVYLTVTQDIETGEYFKSLTNVGLKPTLSDSGALSIESFLLDFSDNLYGRRMRIFFLARLRDEQKFSNREQLHSAISRDVQKGKDVFARLKFVQPASGSHALCVMNSGHCLDLFQPFERIQKLSLL